MAKNKSVIRGLKKANGLVSPVKKPHTIAKNVKNCGAMSKNLDKLYRK